MAVMRDFAAVRYTSFEWPAYRFVPGTGMSHPSKSMAPHLDPAAMQSPVPMDPDDWVNHPAYLYGADLFNHQYWWEAHEAWEHLWHAASDGPHRLFLQGMIQLSAALLKDEVNNARGFRVLRDWALQKFHAVSQSKRWILGINPERWIATVKSHGDDSARTLQFVPVVG